MSEREVISEELRWRVLRRDNCTCRYCGNQSGPFCMDHVYPVSKGGETSFENLVTACQACNSAKHDKVGVWPNPIDYISKQNENKPISKSKMFSGLTKDDKLFILSSDSITASMQLGVTPRAIQKWRKKIHDEMRPK